MAKFVNLIFQLNIEGLRYEDSTVFNLNLYFIPEIRYNSDLFFNLTQTKSKSEDQPIDNFPEKVLNSSLSSFLKIMESPEHSSSRLKRDVGPAGVCCRSGCTKTELVQYC